MKLYASPLQGFTEAPWRNIHHELFGGIDAYYTPFVRVEKGEFRNKDIRDIEKENNKVTCLIPQLIASTPAELEKLVGLFLERGYREADINMGCPAKKVVSGYSGSALMRIEKIGSSAVSSGFVSERKRSLSTASDALETSSRRNTSLFE